MENQQKPKASEIIKDMSDAGRETKQMWNDSKDLKVLQTSIQAYNQAISAAKATVVYKKLTGRPAQMDFFED